MQRKENGWKKWRGGWMLLVCACIVMLVPGMTVQAKSKNQGKAGKNITWTYQPNKKTLTLSGKGYVSISGLRTWNDDDEQVWLGKEDGNLPMFQKIIFQEGITEIDCRFFYLENVKSISLPKSLQKIRYCGESLLSGVNGSFDPWGSAFRTIRVAKQNKKFKVSGGALVSKDGKTLYLVPSGKSMEKYRISGKVTQIANYAFWGTDIRRVVLGKQVTTIGNAAFKHSTVKEVKFNSKLKRINYCAFDSCGLTEVKFPNSLSVIGECAFYGCPLTEVVIPAKVSKIQYEAFGKNHKLEKIVIQGNTAIEEEAFFDTTFYKDSKKNIINQPITVVLGKKMKASVSDLCADLGSQIQFQVDPGNTKYYLKEKDLYAIRGDVLVYQYQKEME
ncbi:MAG: leucine-rich repeat domain-containing protein [Lachnospiraceae bacterium]|nr:leucine-rich repeat domain-containing protein [Lachnospiraceae bacterium]